MQRGSEFLQNLYGIIIPKLWPIQISWKFARFQNFGAVWQTEFVFFVSCATKLCKVNLRGNHNAFSSNSLRAETLLLLRLIDFINSWKYRQEITSATSVTSCVTKVLLGSLSLRIFKRPKMQRRGKFSHSEAHGLQIITYDN